MVSCVCKFICKITTLRWKCRGCAFVILIDFCQIVFHGGSTNIYFYQPHRWVAKADWVGQASRLPRKMRWDKHLFTQPGQIQEEEEHPGTLGKPCPGAAVETTISIVVGIKNWSLTGVRKLRPPVRFPGDSHGSFPVGVHPPLQRLSSVPSPCPPAQSSFPTPPLGLAFQDDSMAHLTATPRPQSSRPPALCALGLFLLPASCFLTLLLYFSSHSMCSVSLFYHLFCH